MTEPLFRELARRFDAHLGCVEKKAPGTSSLAIDDERIHSLLTHLLSTLPLSCKDGTSPERYIAPLAPLREEVACLEDELNRATSELSNLSHQKECLLDVLSRAQESPWDTSVQSKDWSNCCDVLELADATSNMSSRGFQLVKASIIQLLQLMQVQPSTAPHRSGLLLCQQPLDGFLLQQKNLAGDLAELAKIGGAGTIPDHEDDEDAFTSLLHEKVTSEMLVQGMVASDELREFVMLNKLFARIARIAELSEAELVGYMEAAKVAEDLTATDSKFREELSLFTLQSQLSENQALVWSLQEEAEALGEKQLPALLDQVSDVELLGVLREEFKTRASQYSHCVNKQSEMIEHLFTQSALYQVLAAVVGHEKSVLGNLLALLTDMTTRLQGEASGAVARTAALGSLSGSTSNKEECPPAGSPMIQISNFLEFPSTQSTGYDLQDLERAVAHLGTRLEDSEQDFERICIRLRTSASDWSSLSTGLSALLVDGGKVIVGSKEVSQANDQLVKIVSSMEETVRSIQTELQAKQKMIANDELRRLERKLFVYYYSQPEKFKLIVQSIDETRTT